MITKILRAGAIMAAAVTLCGCPAQITATADLNDAAPKAQPLATGPYLAGLGDNSEPVEVTLLENGDYRIRSEEGMDVSFFGPVSGLFVAQYPRPEPDNDFAYAVVQIDAQGAYLAEYELTNILGRMLFDRMDMPTPTSDVNVATLTDNAQINWAILQDLIVKNRSEFTFELFMTPNH